MNDIAVLWPPDAAPIILAIYQTHDDAAATANEKMIPAAARLVLESSASRRR